MHTFIFTTALPPAAAAGAQASVVHLKNSEFERKRQRVQVEKLRESLNASGIPHLQNPSHIVPVMINNPTKCKEISDILLREYKIYVQPIEIVHLIGLHDGWYAICFLFAQSFVRLL